MSTHKLASGPVTKAQLLKLLPTLQIRRVETREIAHAEHVREATRDLMRALKPNQTFSMIVLYY